MVARAFDLELHSMADPIPDWTVVTVQALRLSTLIYHRAPLL